MKDYVTDNLALCPYLQLHGLKYLRAELSVGKNDKPVVSFVFEDSMGIGRDLEIDFMKSPEKRYRDLFHFFRNEIEKMKHQMARLNLQDSRKNDDKYISEKKIKEG